MTPILLIDDDLTFHRVVRVALSEREYSITTATSVSEGIRSLEGNPAIGLILLDLEFPDQNGFEMLKYLNQRPRFSPIPVVVCSGWADHELVTRSLQLGARDFILKPVRAETLRKKVQVAVERSRQSVLVVGSDLQILAVLARIVFREGYRTLLARTGQEALTILTDHPVDVVVSAADMPHMSGRDLLREVKQLVPWQSVILVSDTRKGDGSDLLAGGADGVIRLPFESATVGQTLREALSRSRARSSAPSPKV